MNHTNPIQLQPHWQRTKPLDRLGVIGRALELVEESPVLVAVMLLVCDTKVAAVIVRVQRVVRDRIELMVAHDRQR